MGMRSTACRLHCLLFEPCCGAAWSLFAELFVWEDDNNRTIRFTNARSDGFMKKFDGAWNVQPFTQQTLDKIYKHNVQQQQQDQHKHQWLSPAGVLAAFQQRGCPFMRASVASGVLPRWCIGDEAQLSALFTCLAALLCSLANSTSLTLLLIEKYQILLFSQCRALNMSMMSCVPVPLVFLCWFFVRAGLHVGGPDKLSTLVTLEQAVAPRVTPPGPVAHLVRGLCARVVQNLMADLRQEVHRRQELEPGDDLQVLLDSWPVVYSSGFTLCLISRR